MDTINQLTLHDDAVSLKKSKIHYRRYVTDRGKNIVLWTTFGQVFHSLSDYSGQEFYKRVKTLQFVKHNGSLSDAVYILLVLSYHLRLINAKRSYSLIITSPPQSRLGKDASPPLTAANRLGHCVC